jgi:DNA-binding response OmpR family regulator
MLAVATNIINEILDIDQTVFTKDEIISIVKRVSGVTSLPPIESDGLTLDPERYYVTYNGENHILPRKEFDLLYYLVSNKNKPMNRNYILRDVWGTDICVVNRTVDTHIRKLRSKLNAPNIQTVKNSGYVWKE